MTAAEYFIDPVGVPANGTGTAMAVGPAAPTVSLTATIPAATVNGLSNGNHTVSVRSRDSLGNWGSLASVTLVRRQDRPRRRPP